MNLEQAVAKVVDVLAEAGIEYMLTGSFSSMYYSYPRSTVDADFVVAARGLDVAALAGMLGPGFRLDPQIEFETMGGSIKHEIAVVGTPFTVELFRLKDEPFDQARFTRRKQVELAGKPVWMPSAEDVVIQKLIWNPPKDREDLAAVIAANQDSLDRDYLRDWCERLGLGQLLNEAWRDATPG